MSSNMRLLVGSGNAKKKSEMLRILGGLDLELVGPQDVEPQPPVPPETGETFEENARQKALAYAGATGLLTIADDSGLLVDALDGRPGVHSARFAGVHATDADNNARLLAELKDVPEPARTAAYTCVIALAAPGRVLLVTRGACRGIILREARGTGGFGYDPVFFVPALGRTFAEVSPEEKARVSHRGQALAELGRQLPGVLERELDHP